MTIRKIVIKALNTIGITDVAEAGDGEECVRNVSATEYDIVLLDWNMPKMTGIDALKALREAGKKVPVIMVTTEAEKSRVIEAIKTGANEYLIKPFSPEQLAAKVKNVLPALASA